MALAIRARAKAEETARRLDLWRAHRQASLNAFAWHQPGKIPPLSDLIADKPKAQTAAEQMAVLRALTASMGGAIK